MTILHVAYIHSLTFFGYYCINLGFVQHFGRHLLFLKVLNK